MESGPRTLICGVLLLALPAAAYVWMFKPAWKETATLQDDNRKMKEELSTADMRLGESGIKAETEKLREALDLFKERLPDANEMSKVIDEVCNIAKQHNLNVKAFKNVATTVKDGYGEQTIRWTITGTFKPNLVDFLAALEGRKRISRIADMKVEGDDKYTGQVTADFTLTTFFTPSQTGPAKSVAVAQ
jgi:Tfp pilus assembly protein PilO